MEPVCSINYVADGTMNSVGHLFAASLCNFSREWVYDFIIGGSNELHKKLPDKLLGSKNVEQ